MPDSRMTAGRHSCMLTRHSIGHRTGPDDGGCKQSWADSRSCLSLGLHDPDKQVRESLVGRTLQGVCATRSIPANSDFSSLSLTCLS